MQRKNFQGIKLAGGLRKMEENTQDGTFEADFFIDTIVGAKRMEKEGKLSERHT